MVARLLSSAFYGAAGLIGFATAAMSLGATENAEAGCSGLDYDQCMVSCGDCNTWCQNNGQTECNNRCGGGSAQNAHETSCLWSLFCGIGGPDDYDCNCTVDCG